MSKIATGTVRIGRWTYPLRTQDGVTERNAKRDGSGEWVDVDLADVAEWNMDPEPTEVAEITDPAARSLMNRIANRGFDFFDDGLVEDSGIWFEHACQQTPNAKAARAAFRKLDREGLINLNPDVFEGDDDRWMTLTAKGAAYAATQVGVRDTYAWPAETAGHRAGDGNQSKRPGKSSWKLGEKCPQGHTLTAQNLYVMPSGRKQCRECRSTMPSRQASK